MEEALQMGMEKARLRFRKDLVTELRYLLQADLEPPTRVKTALSVAAKVTIALKFYATGSFQGTTADISNISQFAVPCSICQVTDALYKDQREADGAVNWLCQDSGLPQGSGRHRLHPHRIEGAAKQSRELPKLKGYHSLNVQLVCDHRGQIMAVDARYLGSSHDAFILRQILPGVFELPNEGHGWFLGDKGYPLCTWLRTPLRNPTNPAQQSYNESHAATRGIIEQTITILKHRFHCLDCSGGALTVLA
uniref:putative nuclease HARBI1 n=1 Tax=Pristiophorus japonicus TaxID=55135 RepID=UPI00398ECDCE